MSVRVFRISIDYTSKIVTAAAASTPKEVRAYPQRGSGPVSQAHLERGLRLDLVTSMIFWWKCVHFMRCPLVSFFENSLRWRHNERDGVSNHQPHDCLPIVYSGADQNKHQSFASLAFVRGIHRWPVNSPHKWPVTREMFLFDDVIMCSVDLMSNKWSNLRVRTWKKRKLWYSFNIDQTHINRNWQVGKLYGCSYGLTLIPAWTSNYMPNEVWVKLLIHSKTSSVPLLKFWNG